MPANLTPILYRQTDPSRHGYFSSYVHVTLRQGMVILKNFIRQTEKPLNTMHCYALCCTDTLAFQWAFQALEQSVIKTLQWKG